MQTSNSAVEDWLQIHRQLLESETVFTDLAIKAARGEVAKRGLDASCEPLHASPLTVDTLQSAP